jgi:uncharacterized protein YkwD
MNRIACGLAVVALVGCKAGGQPRPKDEPKAKASDELKLSEDEQAVLDATNTERKAASLPPLTADPKLTEAARGHAANMAKQDKLDHTLDGHGVDARAKAAGYTFSRLGENIAWNQRTPKEAVAGWMQSPGHKENLLNDQFTQIGVAVAKNVKGERYWVQVFGTPR